MNEFLKVAKESGFPRPNGLDGYFRESVFAGVNLRDRRMLDLGGGTGIASFWATIQGGATESVVVDPYSAGSNQSMVKRFHAMCDVVGPNCRVRNAAQTLEEFPASEGQFDVALLHNSINHIGEDVVENLPTSLDAQLKYHAFFELLVNRVEPGGFIIVADCSNRNLFGDLGWKNPVAPQIEWDIHQPPQQWAGMLETHGMELCRISWTARRELGRPGRILLGNRFASYVLNSHFVLVMQKPLGIG